MARRFCPREADARRLSEEALRQARQALTAGTSPILQKRQLTQLLFHLLHNLARPQSRR